MLGSPLTITRHAEENGAHRAWRSGNLCPLVAGHDRIADTSWTETHAGTSAQVTLLLRKWQDGDRDALDRLIPLVYDELKVIASRHMAHEWRQGTLQTTGLVNEAYMKLVDQRDVGWQNRAHFFAIAAQIMRRILLDDVRRRLRTKRGGDAVKVPVDDIGVAAPQPEIEPVDVIAVDRALRRLEQLDPDQAKLVELRFFGGLTVEETADGCSASRPRPSSANGPSRKRGCIKR